MKHVKCWLLALGLIGSVPGGSNASFIPAVDSSRGHLTFSSLGGTFGYAFVTGSAPVTINALGLLTTTPHRETVRIYLDGATTNLASVAVAANVQMSLSSNRNTYSYEAITPVTLLPNTTYDVVADLPARDLLVIQATPVANAPGISFEAARSEIGRAHV